MTNRKATHLNMKLEKIKVKAVVSASKKKVWDFYTNPAHITNWNFAHPSWHCPSASNDLTIGGRYFARMEAKDGSFGFDFEAIYTELKTEEQFTYEFDGRIVRVTFQEKNGITEVVIVFDPETENSIDLQKQGWQAILDNFKLYVESTN